ncbi:acyltransferase family protein [Formosa sp. 3Alg 14/1]|uniref:acyltransferase family protein n=1 Tax=unclassified Formosa TaxID=2644710 RepID=UPI0039BEB8AF
MEKKQFVNSIHYFRAVAIIIIVSGHCFELINFDNKNIVYKLITKSIQGGTAFFVFISGYLFYHIFYQNFNFKKFIIKKIKYVLVPYLFLTTILCLYLFFDTSQIFETSILMIYLSGGIVSAYWYIPFIMIVFILSPLFIKFITLDNNQKIVFIIISLIISLYIHRGNITTNPYAFLHNVIYYTPIYLMGIYVSINKKSIQKKLKGKEFFILILGFLTVIPYVINSTNNFLEYIKKADLMILQKVFFIFFFFIFLERFENTKIKILNKLAENSFGIFFIHCIYIQLIIKVMNSLNIEFRNDYFIYILGTIIVISLSLYTTLITKKIFGKNSRYLIGN